MAYVQQTWEPIVRAVALRANQMQADSASTLASNYAAAKVDDTELGDRAIEFPNLAIEDAILNACDRLIGLIALDVSSPYRIWFADSIGGLASGDLLKIGAPTGAGAQVPTTGNANSIRIGVIGTVYDSTTNGLVYQYRPFHDVINRSKLASLKQDIYWYFTDNIRIYHTGTYNSTPSTVTCDCVIWDKTTQRTALTASPRTACPFPEDLHEAIVCGALSYIFRGDFNSDQAKQWRGYFNETLERLGANVNKHEVQSRLMIV